MYINEFKIKMLKYSKYIKIIINNKCILSVTNVIVNVQQN